MRSVPPTPVTKGWLAGSSAASDLLPLDLRHSSDPVSPEAANTDIPSVAACSNRMFSLPIRFGSWLSKADSQAP